MSTVILLSSSPPRVFARSPTPAESSSPLPSTAALINGNSPGRNRFRTTAAPRDGFARAFTTARQVLGDKHGAENIDLTPLARTRFKSSQGAPLNEASDTSPKRQHLSEEEWKKDPPNPEYAPVKEPQAITKADNPKTNLSNESGLDETIPKSALPERAVARRMDWRPPKAMPQANEDEKPTEYSAGFLNGLLSDFTYVDGTKNVSIVQSDSAQNPTKRRRVEVVPESVRSKVLAGVPTLGRNNSAPARLAPKRNRSPAKKPLTITGLATSNFLGEESEKETPLMQYLTSTQAQMDDNVTNSVLQTTIKKTKAASKKLKESRKFQVKVLLSPKSAMKTFDEQEAIFGSASQLARDESPELLRETIEAMKQSESFIFSDSISSPHRTQPLSVENTPKAGTAKFRKTRNLWAAAGRDEDNALLQMETIDLIDTPAVRAAFAGKDALFQPRAQPQESKSIAGGLLHHSCSPLRKSLSGSVVDIDDIDTPNLPKTRDFSTTVDKLSPRKSTSRTHRDLKESAVPVTADASKSGKPPPTKPCYAGFATRDLNKQIVLYGFKAMRSREKMIALLDRCWDEKYGTGEVVVDEKQQAVPFGDFLSNVHDLSTRPEPKIKKPRIRKKKSEDNTGPKNKPVRKPRQRKSQDLDGKAAEDKLKAPRKRKSKTASFVEDTSLDVEKIWHTIPEELRVLEAFDDWAKPVKTAKTTAQNIPPVTGSPGVQQPLTPPLAPSVDDAPTLSHRIEPVPEMLAVKVQPASTDLTPDPTLAATIASQIEAAILRQSQTSDPNRNHNVNPTWHEKILLYDPIVLEDLAAWLNTDGFRVIGEDREASALDVREWCESKGICCLWRGGWRGNKAAQ